MIKEIGAGVVSVPLTERGFIQMTTAGYELLQGMKNNSISIIKVETKKGSDVEQVSTTENGFIQVTRAGYELKQNLEKLPKRYPGRINRAFGFGEQAIIARPGDKDRSAYFAYQAERRELVRPGELKAFYKREKVIIAKMAELKEALAPLFHVTIDKSPVGWAVKRQMEDTEIHILRRQIRGLDELLSNLRVDVFDSNVQVQPQTARTAVPSKVVVKERVKV